MVVVERGEKRRGRREGKYRNAQVLCSAVGSSGGFYLAPE